MKRILLSSVAAAILMGGQAMAADLSVRNRAPVYKAPPMATAAYNWSGCYIGAHIGGGWGTTDFDGSEGSGSTDVDGILGGGQIGCNLQSGQVVWGVEGDFSGSGIDGSDSFFSGADVNSKVEWLSTVTARVGFAVDQYLFYAKGGAAFASTKYDVNFGGNSFNEDQTRVGWTVGGGLEFALVDNWTAKIEYNYIDLGSDSVNLGGSNLDVDQQIHVVKFGVNYRFGGGPIVARY